MKDSWSTRTLPTNSPILRIISAEPGTYEIMWSTARKALLIKAPDSGQTWSVPISSAADALSILSGLGEKAVKQKPKSGRTHTGGMVTPHEISFPGKVQQMVQQLNSQKKYCFPPIVVMRLTDNSWFVVDGVHRAVASCILSVAASYEEVSTNEWYTVADVEKLNREGKLYLVAKLAANCRI